MRRNLGEQARRRFPEAVAWASAVALLAIFTTFVLTRGHAPRISIRWNIEDSRRELLERQFQLSESARQDNGTWAYDLIDTSRQNIRAILADRGVVAAIGLDPQALRPVTAAPQGRSRIWLADRLPIVKRPFVVPAIFLLLLTALGASIAGLRWTWSLPRLERSPVMRFFASRVPSITLTELGLYRVVFGLCLYWVFESLRISPAAVPRQLHVSNAPLADWEWIHWLASSPQAAALLEQLVIATLVAFIVGIMSRPMYWLLAAELLVWTLVRLQRTGTHSWAVALVTVIGLLPIRWGDGFSVDEMIRRWRGRTLPAQRRGRGYGFALWLPGLVLGTAMAGAGIAKLRGGGIDWILGGAVKYHFVVDSRNAPVDWGLWVASHHWAAVAMSLMAVTAELGLGLGPWLRTYRARLPLALAGLGLLVGFYLFQNERWLAWWMLWGLFYVPWPRLFRLCRRAIPAHLVLIDTDCARCRRTARVLAGLDVFNRLRFIPIQRRVVWRNGGETVREDELFRSMHAVCLRRHRLVRGYRAYLHIGRSLPICWPLLPIGGLLLIGNIGERLYARLGKSRRRKLGEACPLPSAVPTRGASLGWTHATVTLIVCLLQVTASVTSVEVEPLMSSYPMYSNTYQSTDDFDRRVTLNRSYSFGATVNGQEEDVTELFDELGVDEAFRDALLRLAENDQLDNDARTRVRAAVSLFESRTGRSLTHVWLKTDQQAFDWHRGVFYQKSKGKVVGMLDVRSLEGT